MDGILAMSLHHLPSHRIGHPESCPRAGVAALLVPSIDPAKSQCRGFVDPPFAGVSWTFDGGTDALEMLLQRLGASWDWNLWDLWDFLDKSVQKVRKCAGSRDMILESWSRDALQTNGHVV